MTDLNRKIKHWMGMVAGASRLYDRSFGSMLSVVAFHRVDDEIGSGPITCTAETFEEGDFKSARKEEAEEARAHAKLKKARKAERRRKKKPVNKKKKRK